MGPKSPFGVRFVSLTVTLCGCKNPRARLRPGSPRIRVRAFKVVSGQTCADFTQDSGIGAIPGGKRSF